MMKKIDLLDIKSSNCTFSRERTCNVKYDPMLVFIAGTGDTALQNEIKIINETLIEKYYEPYFALFESTLGLDASCEKICSKIRASNFCVVYLTAPKINGSLQASVNVYWEYGLMNGLNKDVIPLIKDGQKLPFNVRNIDIKFYSNEEGLRKKVLEGLAYINSIRFPPLPKKLEIYLEKLQYKNITIKKMGVITRVKGVSFWPLECCKSEKQFEIKDLGKFEIFFVYKRTFGSKFILILGKYLERFNEEEINQWVQKIENHYKTRKKIHKTIIVFFIKNINSHDVEKIKKIDDSSESYVSVINEDNLMFGNPFITTFFDVEED